MAVNKNDRAADDGDPWAQSLARVALSQDSHAFAALFDHFSPRLNGFLHRLGLPPNLAEDVVQETFIAIWRKASTFNPAKSSVATWIYTIARNKRIDRLRNMALPEPDPTDPAFEPDPPEFADAQLVAYQRSQRVRRAFEQLSVAQRDALYLSFYVEQSHAEIAENLRAPLGTVKSRLRLGLERLRQIMDDEIKDGSL